MIVQADPDVILARWWAEVRQDPRLSELAALAPTDRRLSILDGIGLLPVVMAILSGPQRQLDTLDAAARAYLRAAGLHISEE